MQCNVSGDDSFGMTVIGPNSQEIALNIPNGQIPSVEAACEFFNTAKAISPCFGTASNSLVVGETTKALNPSVVLVTDPPNVHGNGGLSGSQYFDYGMVIWVPGYDLTSPASTENLGYTVQAGCAMAASKISVCQAVLNFVNYWYTNPSTAGF